MGNSEGGGTVITTRVEMINELLKRVGFARRKLPQSPRLSKTELLHVTNWINVARTKIEEKQKDKTE